jgi:hypothetical protein
MFLRLLVNLRRLPAAIQPNSITRFLSVQGLTATDKIG